jgi:hypothetical protein
LITQQKSFAAGGNVAGIFFGNARSEKEKRRRMRELWRRVTEPERGG